jgi:hypothetical protein
VADRGQLGIVKSIYDYYPFGLWQMGGIAVIAGVIWQIRYRLNPELLVFAGWTGSLFMIFLFNRSMNYSYLGIMEVAVAIMVLWSDKFTLRQKISQKVKS